MIKSLFYFLALKCAFGADTSLFSSRSVLKGTPDRRSILHHLDKPIFREIISCQCLPPGRQRGLFVLQYQNLHGGYREYGRLS